MHDYMRALQLPRRKVASYIYSTNTPRHYIALLVSELDVVMFVAAMQLLCAEAESLGQKPWYCSSILGTKKHLGATHSCVHVQP